MGTGAKAAGVVKLTTTSL